MERLRKNLWAATTGCSTALAALFVAGLLVLNTALFTVRDVVSVAAPSFRHTPILGWLARQPRPLPSEQDAGGVSCSLSWKRISFQSGRYWVSCTAREPVELSELSVVARPQGGALDGWAYEEQWPLADQTATIQPDRTWTYDGTLMLGWDVLPLQDVPRDLSFEAKLRYPDLSEAEHERLRDRHPDRFRILLVASEPY